MKSELEPDIPVCFKVDLITEPSEPTLIAAYPHPLPLPGSNWQAAIRS
jgi:hypothetical protein